MVFPALTRPSRSASIGIAAALFASTLVAVAAPASASAPAAASVSAATAAAAAAVAPEHAGVAGQLPLALRDAAALAAAPPSDAPGGSADISGTVAFPAGVAPTSGRTFVVAHAPGAEGGAPLAAAAVAADGTYLLRAPIGEVALSVLSEGRAVTDRVVHSPAGDGAASIALPAEGLAAQDIALDASALISGTVAGPAGVSLAGDKVVVAVYPADGSGTGAVAANYVRDDGTYAVGGMPAGQYRVAFLSAASGAVSEWWNDSPTFAKANTVPFDGASVASGVDAVLAALRIIDSSTPTVSGTATLGQTLKAAPGVWTAGATLSYQWYANGVAIAKATTSSLVLAAAIAGKRITVRVTGTKAGFAPKALVSAATAAVLRTLTAPVPAVTGTATVGQTLKVKTGTWTAGTKLTYQWYINGAAVSKATAATFKIPAAAAVKTITVVVTGTKAGYAKASKRSKATASVKGVLAAPVPGIKGAALFGSRLTAAPRTWTSGTRLSYQWYANGKAIKGATGSSLVLSAATVRTRVTVKVTGTKSGYISASKVSKATGVISYPAQAKPVSSWNCPSWAPIKGNRSSMIYHVKSGAYYAKTKPEACFSSEAAAVKAGYRKSKR